MTIHAHRLGPLARPSGGFAMVANDQREALRHMIAGATGQDVEAVADQALRAFKVAVAEELSPSASALLLDREFALDAVLETGALAPGCALIVAVDHITSAPDGAARSSVFDRTADMAAHRAAGAAAAKLLVLWDPEEPAAPRREETKAFVAACHDVGLAAVLEPVVPAGRAPDPVTAGHWIVEAARELGSLGADLYKAQVPLAGRGSDDDTVAWSRRLTAVLPCPWVCLSNGVAPEDFPRAVTLTCRGGASGFLAGRAVWSDCVGDTPAARLRRIAVPRLAALAHEVDRVARPWTARRDTRRQEPAQEPLDVPRAVTVATARPTFAVAVAQERARAARLLLAKLGAEVIGPDDLVMTPADAEAAAGHLDASADLVVHLCASFSDATPALRLYGDAPGPVLLWAFREPGPVGDRLWLNSLCGANLFGHALVAAGRDVRLLYGDPDEPAVRHALQRALEGELPPAAVLPTRQRERGDRGAAHAALGKLRGRSIGVVGDAPAGFTPCEYDAGLVDRLFGLRIETLTIPDLLDRVAAVAPGERAAERDQAATAQPSLLHLDPEQVDGWAAVTATLRDWSTHGAVSAVAIRCWPEVPSELGVCPCSSLSRLADEGTPTACERDVYGVITMLLLEALGSGTTYLVDTVDLDLDRNVVRVWHCGSAATALAANPAAALQDVHCNRGVGVAGNFPLRTGAVVMSRLCEDPDPANPTRLRLLVAAGESLPEPNRFQGNTAAVRLDAPAGDVVNALVTGGFPHHTVLAWNDVRPTLRSAADLLGIPVVEW